MKCPWNTVLKGIKGNWCKNHCLLASLLHTSNLRPFVRSVKLKPILMHSSTSLPMFSHLYLTSVWNYRHCCPFRSLHFFSEMMWIQLYWPLLLTSSASSVQDENFKRSFQAGNIKYAWVATVKESAHDYGKKIYWHSQSGCKYRMGSQNVRASQMNSSV